MDLISDVMTVLRAGRPYAGRFTRTAPWSNRHPSHPHEFDVRIMVRGNAVVTAATGQTIELAEGDALLIPHGAEHVIGDAVKSLPGAVHGTREARAQAVFRSDDPAATHVALCMAYELAPNRTHPLIATLPDFVHVKADPLARPELAQATAMLDGELAAELRGGDALVPALLDAVLMYLLRAIHGARHAQCGFSGWAAALADGPIAASLEAIHADPARQWTVASLGEVAGLSRSAFSRRFTDLLGQPPLGYLTSWRLTLAARLLADTDAPLAVVARRVGYASEFAFAAAFKRDFGTPPGQFRKAAPACDPAAEPFRRDPVPA
jgi:AraC-like DNA-binding protein